MGPLASVILIALWLFLGGLVLLGTGLGVPAVILFVIFTAAVVRCILVYRRSREAYVISVLSSAVRQVLPLPEALYLEASRNTDSQSVVLRKMADGLMAGLPLCQAIRSSWPLCPGAALSLIEAGERLNQLPQALATVEADLLQRRKDYFRFRSGHPLYPMMVLLATLGMMTAALPKLANLLEGMNVPSSPAWRRLTFCPEAYPILFLSIVGWGAMYLYSLFRPRSPDRPRMLSRFGDRVKWWLPVWRWFERNGSLLQTVEAIRLSLRAGQPVDVAVAEASMMDTNFCYRRRLRKWLARIQRGDEIAPAAVECGVGKGLAWAMDPQVNPSGSLDVLETLERLYRANYNYAATVARTFFWPCLTIAMGVLVAIMAMAIVEPLAALTAAQMGSVVPR